MPETRGPSVRPASPRRQGLEQLLVRAVGGAGVLSALAARGAGAQTPPGEVFTVSGSGVNVKEMPGVDGTPVPLRESFGLDAHYAQCIVEDNPAAFVMPTYSMGTVTIEPHAFFMAMYASQIALVSVNPADDGKLVAKLIGVLDCHTYAGTATVAVGSREGSEPATFEIEAVDGGRGSGQAGDRFAFTVFFDPRLAPVNHGVFGPQFTFTGDMVAGNITIAPPVGRPLGDG
jgi:hypothetical protein